MSADNGEPTSQRKRAISTSITDDTKILSSMLLHHNLIYSGFDISEDHALESRRHLLQPTSSSLAEVGRVYEIAIIFYRFGNAGNRSSVIPLGKLLALIRHLYLN